MLMKKYITLSFFLLGNMICLAQVKKITDPLTPCNGTADAVAGIYTDHTNPKYGSHSIRGNAITKAAMTKNLIAIEKLEEASRKNFKLTGCAARVSFSGGDNADYGKSTCLNYGYTLGVYAYVCHVKEFTTKIVGEYMTVLRINVNPDLVFAGNYSKPGTGDLSFAKTANSLMWNYDFPSDALLGPNYETDRVKSPSKVSKYISESNLLAGRSSAYKNYHPEFTKLNSGNSYTENYLRGSVYDKVTEDSYRLIDRRYLITKPGIPLLIPVSRQQYLQDMLEYFEIEKANFNYTVDNLLKNAATDNSNYGMQQKQTWQTHRAAYLQHYEAKKAKIKELLASKKEAWLQLPAVVAGGNAIKEQTKRLAQTGVFYEMEDKENDIYALYVANPTYFSSSTSSATNPKLIEISFRYELNKDKGYSERLISNFEKNFDFDELRKMVE